MKGNSVFGRVTSPRRERYFRDRVQREREVGRERGRQLSFEWNPRSLALCGSLFARWRICRPLERLSAVDCRTPLKSEPVRFPIAGPQLRSYGPPLRYAYPAAVMSLYFQRSARLLHGCAENFCHLQWRTFRALSSSLFFLRSTADVIERNCAKLWKRRGHFFLHLHIGKRENSLCI